MIDELSLILLIENELTRGHSVQTVEEAMALWKNVYSRSNSLLKAWFERDDDASGMTTTISRQMLTLAVRYEVMLGKMLRQIPQVEQKLRLVSERDKFGMTLLHRAAESGNVESIKVILALDPNPEYWFRSIVHVKDTLGGNALHCAAQSGNARAMDLILALYPSPEQRLHAVSTMNVMGETVLCRAARSGNIECVDTVLALYPESERLQALRLQETGRATVLHHVAGSSNAACVQAIIDRYPESERYQAVSTPTKLGWTPLHFAARSGHLACVETLLSHYPESQRLQAMCQPDRDGRTPLHLAASSRLDNPEVINAILGPCMKAERSVILKMRDNKGNTLQQWAARSSNTKTVKAILDLYSASAESQCSQALSIAQDRIDSTIKSPPKSEGSGRKRTTHDDSSLLQAEQVDRDLQPEAKRQRSEDSGSR